MYLPFNYVQNFKLICLVLYSFGLGPFAQNAHGLFEPFDFAHKPLPISHVKIDLFHPGTFRITSEVEFVEERKLKAPNLLPVGQIAHFILWYVERALNLY